MNPPYELTPEILKKVMSISMKIGEVNANYLVHQDPKLRKHNQIKTIHSSLYIEGNTLSEEQMTAIIENKRVIGPEKDIKEVLNALQVYKGIKNLSYDSEKDFRKAHELLMTGLIEMPGNYRKKSVGIVKGGLIEHIAPPFDNVPFLMENLFTYLKNSPELTVIKSCVFHYEMEFIHPFMDGNGRMGRLWQTLILRSEFPVFEFLPFETLIAKNQIAYYDALSASDKEGKSTKFIVYMLGIIDESLDELLMHRPLKMNETERLDAFLNMYHRQEFKRKDYLQRYPELSSATASRDLKNGVEKGIIEKYGDKKTTYYRQKSN